MKLRIWRILEQSEPIWFFGATGSILRKYPRQQMPFLYSIIVYDRQKKLYISIADFFTTSQTKCTISKYLLSVQTVIEKNNLPIARTIVSDGCEASINVMFIF